MRARFAGINPRTGERFSIVVVPAGKIERWPTRGRVPVRQEGDEWAEKRGAYFYVNVRDLEPLLFTTRPPGPDLCGQPPGRAIVRT